MESKPTRYHKINARSRTEARWATFFDGLYIPYAYEEEDFYLETLHKRYLPDFNISSPIGNVAVEVKGKKTPLDIEVEKCNKLCYEQALHTLLLNGSPWNQDYQAQLFYPDYDLLECKNCQKKLFPIDMQCSECGSFDIGYYLASRIVRQCDTQFTQAEINGFYVIHTSGLPIVYSYLANALQFAFKLATRARFEYFVNDWMPNIWDSIAINPAYQTQDWTEAELLFNCLEGMVSIETCETWVQYGVTIHHYIMNFEESYNALTLGGARTCIKSCENILNHTEKCIEWLHLDGINLEEFLSDIAGPFAWLRENIPIEMDYYLIREYSLMFSKWYLWMVFMDNVIYSD